MTTLQSLLDEREIVNTLGRFARLLDSKSLDQIEEVFAEDVVFDYGAGQDQHGIEALRELMGSFLLKCGGTQHLIGSIMIDVDGDSANSSSYVQARHHRKGELIGATFDSNGEYVDRWERRPQGWRIVRRDALWAGHSGDPDIIAASAVVS